MRPHSMRNSNQFLHDDQTRCEENFTASTLTLSKMTRMLTRDLFGSFSAYMHESVGVATLTRSTRRETRQHRCKPAFRTDNYLP